MPRRSGTDVLFPKWTRPAVFFAGRVLFFGCCFIRPGLWHVAAPVCGALLLRSVLRRCSRLVPCRCSALCRVVILGLHRLPSPFVPCRRSRPVPRRHPRSASVAVPVCAVSPLRFASHCHPLSASCRRSGLRMAAAGEFCGWFGGESVRAAGLLRPFPALRRFRSGRPSAFL